MENAECKINKPSLLIEACKLIDQMEIAQTEPGCAGRPVRIPACQAKHCRAQRPVPHTAPHHPHDGADDRTATQRAHRRPGGRHLRFFGQCLPVYPRNAHLA